MRFGDSAVFAIEALIDAIPIAGDVWGTSCIFIGGLQIGDLSERHCGISHFGLALNEAVRRLPGLHDDQFAPLSDAEVFDMIDSRLYRLPARSNAERDTFQKFDFLTNVGEHFDGWKTFIFRRDEYAVTILAQDEESSLHSASAPVETFVTRVREYTAWFDAQITIRNTAR